MGGFQALFNTNQTPASSGGSSANSTSGSPAAAVLSGSGPGVGNYAQKDPSRSVAPGTGSTDNGSTGGVNNGGSVSTSPAPVTPTPPPSALSDTSTRNPNFRAAATLSGVGASNPSDSFPANPGAAVKTTPPNALPPPPTTPAASTAYSGPNTFLAPSAAVGSSPTGTTQYNTNYYATPDSASAMASYLGPGYSVGTGNQTNTPGSPYSSPNYNTIVGPDGTAVNAGLLNSYFTQYGNDPAYLKQQVANSFSQQGQSNSQQAPYIGVGSTANPFVGTGNTGQTPGAAIQPGTQGQVAATPTPTPAASNTLSSPASTPASTTNPGSAGGLSYSDLMSFLQAYGNLQGGGAASTAAAPASSTANNIDPILAMLFGGQQNYDLYQRQLQYPATP